MIPVAALLTLKRIGTTAVAVWQALPAPVKVMILVGVAFMFGFWRGEVREARKCEARIEASIALARATDKEISDRAVSTAEAQARDAAVRETATKTEIRAYVDEVAKRTGEACAIGADADRNNDGLGVQDDGLPAPRAKPPARRGDRAKPGPVPARGSK